MLITSLPQLHRFLKSPPPSSETLPKLLVCIEDTSFTSELFGHFMDRLSHLPENITHIHLTFHNFHFMLAEPQLQHFQSLNALHFSIKELIFDLPKFEYLTDSQIVEAILDLVADKRRENSLESFQINASESFELELNKKKQLFRLVVQNRLQIKGIVFTKITQLLQPQQYELQVVKIKFGKKNDPPSTSYEITEANEQLQLLVAVNKVSTNLRILSLEVFYQLKNNALDLLQRSFVNQKKNPLVTVNIYVRSFLPIEQMMRLLKGLGDNVRYANIVFEENSTQAVVISVQNMHLSFTLRYNPLRLRNQQQCSDFFEQALCSWKLNDIESFTFICESKSQSLLLCRAILDSFQFSLGKLKQCRIFFNEQTTNSTESIPIKSLISLIQANHLSMEILEIKVNFKSKVDESFFSQFFKAIRELRCLQNLLIDFGKIQTRTETAFFTSASQQLLGISESLEVLELISPIREQGFSPDAISVAQMIPIVASHLRLKTVKCVQERVFLSLESEKLKGNLNINSSSDLNKLFGSFHKNKMANELLSEIDFEFNIHDAVSTDNMNKILEGISCNVLRINIHFKAPPSILKNIFGLELHSFKGLFSLKHNDIQKILAQDNVLSLEFCNDDLEPSENSAEEEESDENQDPDVEMNEKDNPGNNKEQNSGAVIETANDQQIQLPAVVNIKPANNNNDESDSVWSSSNDNNNNNHPDSEEEKEEVPQQQQQIATKTDLEDKSQKQKKSCKQKKKKQFKILNSLATQEFSELRCNLSFIQNKNILLSLIPHLHLSPRKVFLNFSQCWLRDEDMQFFEDIFGNLPANMQSIELDLSSNPQIHNKGSIKLFKKLNRHWYNLKNLNLNISGTSIKTKGILALAKKISKLKVLKELNLNISSSSSMNKMKPSTPVDLFQAVVSLHNLTKFVLQANDNFLIISQKFFDSLGAMFTKLPSNMVELHLDFSLNQLSPCDIKKVKESLCKLPITLERFFLNLDCIASFDHAFLVDLMSMCQEFSKLPGVQSLTLILPTYLTNNSDLVQILTAYQKILIVLLIKNFRYLNFSIAGIKLTIESNTLFFSMTSFLQSAQSLTSAQLKAEAYTFYQIFLAHKRSTIRYAENISFFPAEDIKKYEIRDTLKLNGPQELDEQHEEDIQQIEEEDSYSF